jgi:hypothetical protein
MVADMAGNSNSVSHWSSSGSSRGRSSDTAARLSNAGRNMVHLFSRSPAYADLLARARREDRRLSLVEREVQALWCPVEWLDEWKRGGR